MTPCFYCSVPSSLLCDGVVAWVKGNAKTYDVKSKKPPEPITCDRPMCAEHVARRTRGIACRGSLGPLNISLDYCPDCVDALEMQKTSGGIPLEYASAPVLSPAEALELNAARAGSPA